MYDFIISGAGLAGALAARVLQKFGYSVFIFDQAKSLWNDERISAIGCGAKNILEKFGLWNHLEEFSSPIVDIYTASSCKNPFYLHFSAKEFMGKHGGSHIRESVGPHLPLAYTVPNFAIQKVLYDETLDINFSAQYESVVTSSEKVTAKLTNGRTIEGRIFICAEGKNSSLRSNLCIPTYKKKYQQYALVCSLSHEIEHKNSAQEIFYDTPFALLPLRSQYHSSLILTLKAKFAHLMLKLSDAEFIKLLNTKCNLKVDQIISKKSIFPLSLTFALKYSSDRILFFGDAIHSIHPVAGQGFNLTIYDLVSLVNSINSFDIHSDKYKYIFSKFYCERFDENLKMALFTDSIVKLFSIQNSALSFARSFGLSFINGSNILKDFFIKKAIGYYVI